MVIRKAHEWGKGTQKELTKAEHLDEEMVAHLAFGMDCDWG